MLRARATSLLAGRGRRHCSAELAMLQQLLAQAQHRVAAAEKEKAAAAVEAVVGPRFQIQTFNAISKVGLSKFGPEFMLTGDAGPLPDGVDTEPHAILLRSHKLQPDEVAPSVRAIARCGAGTNNIPIEAMTEAGVPVFNTPGANANSVKEMVLCGLLLASRGVVEGINHVNTKIVPESTDGHKQIAARIEKDKKQFVGGEIAGKTLAVLGLGNIGALVAECAIALGMDVIGYDPKISVDAAWRLPNTVKKTNSLEEALASADYASVNMPYIKGVTHHVLNGETLAIMKKGCHLLNFSRGEIVDGVALRRLYDQGHTGKYVCDFADEAMQDHPKFLCVPHLGASTAEAEDNCAAMAAAQVVDYLETGTIINSVNFPTASLARQDAAHTRLCIINKNNPGVLGEITTLLGSHGVNIAQQLNTSREGIAYNVIDMQDYPHEDSVAQDMQEQILGIPDVISTRLIWTGRASEGPTHFYTKSSHSMDD